MNTLYNKSEKHIFALFVKKLSDHVLKKSVHISDLPLVHRITHILRLQVGDDFILFDRASHAKVRISAITKKTVNAEVLLYEKNKQLVPRITLLLPVLKKDALSDAVYSAVEVGASAIQLVQTQKSSRAVSLHELDRLERVAISAAEQSKQFAFPEVKKPIKLKEVAELNGGVGVFFDPTGCSVQKQLEGINRNGKEIITVLIGPEGDLTNEEKQFLKKSKWHFCALTPTVLRSVQAVAIGLGIFRIFIK